MNRAILRLFDSFIFNLSFALWFFADPMDRVRNVIVFTYLKKASSDYQRMLKLMKEK